MAETIDNFENIRQFKDVIHFFDILFAYSLNQCDHIYECSIGLML